MTDWELVHNVCAYDRLTLFNYLRMADPKVGEEAAKQLILDEYMYYFNLEELNIYKDTNQKIKNVFDIEIE
eukprot:CAMPEP_0168344298 /NCGR_PEP_ID=MMETSP0213-20121227/16729_1 /TAXON_ID=151035 /ORGANISM="Euplotes harpa, Strain FSP1.4" /LENGTH=70 /DNA_ID=CAMNT_0008352005 /DNA_START=391 /DNA_END=603 /DNA_ORIENTATION=+